MSTIPSPATENCRPLLDMRSQAPPDRMFSYVSSKRTKTIFEEAKKAGLYYNAEEFLDSAFPQVQRDNWPSRIDAFFEDTELYDWDLFRWRPFGTSVETVDDLSHQVLLLIESLTAYFDIGRRKVLYTKPNTLRGMKPCSNLMIVGKGGNAFEKTTFPVAPDYRYCIAPIETLYDADLDLSQLEWYATNCLAAQSHRRFVYSLAISRDCAHLFLYTRSGCIHSSEFDYHNRPDLFVRFILGLLSEDETDLGYDPTICWTGEGDRKRIANIMLEGGNVESCDVHLNEPVWGVSRIYGPSTRCWVVKAPRKGYLVVKEFWQDKRFPGEIEFYKAINDKKLPGVARMISYEIRGRAFDLECLRPFYKKLEHIDRIWLRITLEQYGPDMELWTSKLQVLYVWYDCIRGHRYLWSENILHRDIKLSNLVAGRPEAPEGYRGILIDFESAMWVNTPESLRFGGPVGTAPVASAKVTQGMEFPYTFYDDLEAFLLTLALLCTCYIGPGTRMLPVGQCPPTAQRLLRTEFGKGHNVILKKDIIKAKAQEFTCEVQGYFGEAFKQLLQDLAEVLSNGFEDRTKPYDGKTAKCAKEIFPHSGEVYDRFLACLRTAIETVEKEEKEAEKKAKQRENASKAVTKGEGTAPLKSIDLNAGPTSPKRGNKRNASALDSTSSGEQSRSCSRTKTK
ncbi:hypothetical protein BDN72DRAFT_964766 [Pluteus cervinus]|uniref:Uncharacterized protein n=1 Tax=Pluteus cervinus TaxID=181527 RepID=A0ACD3A9M5_9AGAR|nr:hypothetical protein BDN72DRAFT_964766 [Pluteus cervinus]